MTEEEILEIGVQAGMNPAIMLLDGNFKLLKKFAKLLAEKEYERGFIDGMQKQMQSSVDKAVNAMTRPTYYIPSKEQRTWVGLTDDEVFELFGRFTTMTGKSWLDLYRMAEAKLKDKNT